MILKFQSYIENQMVRKGSPDKGEAESLLRKAEGRLRYSIKAREINENTAPYIFEDIYECIREAAQSLMAIKGYKPYSHEALISYLSEFFDFPESDINAFDRYRILRNKTVYRGESISEQTCRESLDFLLRFLPLIRKEFAALVKGTP